MPLWNTSDPAAPALLGTPLTGHGGRANAVASARDGNTLASAGDDGTVRLWDLAGLVTPREHVMERACSITDAGRNEAEWARYVEGVPYVDVCDT